MLLELQAVLHLSRNLHRSHLQPHVESQSPVPGDSPSTAGLLFFFLIS